MKQIAFNLLVICNAILLYLCKTPQEGWPLLLYIASIVTLLWICVGTLIYTCIEIIDQARNKS